LVVRLGRGGGAVSVVERVRTIVEPLLAEDGLECFDVEFGSGRLVVLADRDGGVDLGALTRATHKISAALDREDPIPGGRYVLEVSSPGLERRLRTPAHFRRYLGTTLSVKTVPGSAGDRRCKGTLTAADDDGIVIDERRIGYADIERATTVFEWEPAPKPGRGSKPGKGPKADRARPVPPSDQKAPAS
jgi:ribosome maturation factor RimP